MAKNDYFVIVYYILQYLYACLKASALPDVDILLLKAYPAEISEEYVRYIWEHLSIDGYVEGSVVKEFHGLKRSFRVVRLERLDAIKITPKGIQYLLENSMMAKAKVIVKDFSGLLPW